MKGFYSQHSSRMRVPTAGDRSAQLRSHRLTRLYIYSYNQVRSLKFLGTSKDDLSAFPAAARTRAGYELFMVQVGRAPDDWKPMPAVGGGACEIRVRDRAGAYRVIYVARFQNAVYVLHAFQKKSQKTSRRDIELARARYRDARALDEE